MSKFTTSRVVSAQCAEDMDLTAGIRSTEETCKLIFFAYSMLASPKNASFIYIFDARIIKPASHAYVFTNFILFEAPHDVSTSLQLSTDCEQDKTPKRLENVCVLSDVCVCVDISFSFVSVLFVSFLFCPCSVSILFLFYFVSLVWTLPYGSIWLKIEIVRQLR